MAESYKHLVKYVRESAWALEPWALATMLEVLDMRLQGERLTDEEIQERIEGSEYHAEHEAVEADTIAVIPIHGLIGPRMTMMARVSGGTSLPAVQQALRAAAGDPSVRAILLDVNSPGGSVDLVPETAAVIREVRESKDVYAVANTRAASAAYWLATQASKLYVSPSGAVGSVGVYAAHEDLSKAMEGRGIKTTFISAGKYKVEGNPYEPLSDEAKAHAQKSVDAYYDMFVADIAEGRGTSTKNVLENFGKGRMILAKYAADLGMVDGIATIRDVVGKIASEERSAPNYNPSGGTVSSVTEEEQMSDFVLKVAQTLGLTVEDDRVLSADGQELDEEAILSMVERPAPEEPEEPEEEEAFARAYPEEAKRLASLEEENRRHRVSASIKAFEEQTLAANGQRLSPDASEKLQGFLMRLSETHANEVLDTVATILQEGIVDFSEKGSGSGSDADPTSRIERAAYKAMEEAEAAGKPITFREAIDLVAEEKPSLIRDHVTGVASVGGDEEKE